MKRSQQQQHSPELPDLWGLLAMPARLVAALALGAALGALGSLLLRRRALGWSWALLAAPAPIALIAALIEGRIAPSRAALMALAASLGFCAALIWLGVALRLQDRRAGADRELAARARLGPLGFARGVLAARRRSAPEDIPLGRGADGQMVSVPRGSAASGEHVLIAGATGAGKTTSLAVLLSEYVARSGFGAVVIEAKSDRALLEAARRAAGAAGTAFHLISAEGPMGYDPLASGGVDERSERLVAVHDWGSSDADFYRQAASPFLRCVLEVLDASEGGAGLRRVAEACDRDKLRELVAKEGSAEMLERVKRETAALNTEERRAVAGMAARLRNLATSQFASRWLDPDRPGAQVLDLRAAIERREVVYFRLDTDRTGNVGRAIAQMALLDLGAAASAAMDSGDGGTFVAIDEFGALEAAALERLFVRARAAGFSVAVGTQTIADLSAAGAAVRDRIGATITAIICHRLGGQEDAEWVARLIGTVPTWESTVRTDALALPTGEGTRTRGHRFEVNPAQLQRLPRGEAYVARFDHDRARRAARARVVPAWERFRPNGAGGKRGGKAAGRRGKR